jgi:hypothetical protein
MKRWLAAVTVTFLALSGIASAQNQSEPPVSPTQLQRILKYIDKIGAKQNFPAPTAQSLGLSKDPAQALPVTVIMTNDHRVYFCRSDLNHNDYVIWTRMPGNVVSYMFSTNASFALSHALYLHTDDFPRTENVNAPQVQDIYKKSLAALVADIDKSPPP